MAERVKTRFKERPRFYFREWRKYRGLTQEQLAERIGTGTSSISQLETGKQGWTDSTLIAVADALRCEPGDLLRINPLVDGEVVDLMALLRGAPAQVREQAYAIVATLLQTGTYGVERPRPYSDGASSGTEEDRRPRGGQEKLDETTVPTGTRSSKWDD